jgi:hypothetical protein
VAAQAVIGIFADKAKPVREKAYFAVEAEASFTLYSYINYMTRGRSIALPLKFCFISIQRCRPF